MTHPYYEDDAVTLYHGRAEDVLPGLDAASVDVLLTDPPYFQVKDDDWDRQWKKRDEFLDWLGGILDAAAPALKPSVSVWVFASPALTSRVQHAVVEPRLRVLNSIRWVKEAGWHQKAEIEAQRRYLTAWEGVIFAEQAMDRYRSADYEGHKAAFRELGSYLEAQRQAVGLTRAQLAEALSAAGIYSTTESALANISLQEIGSQMLSARTHAAWAAVVPLKPHAELVADYAGARVAHKKARLEYENLRRPFRLARSGPVTDVWNFRPVMGYEGKHPCEKPLAMLDHMLSVSSKPGAMVLDPFAGSGSTLRAAKDLGRRAIGVEIDERYCETAARRLAQDTLFGEEPA